jgi:predicted lipoprotein with Yx(FWY)xxD motif
VLKTFVVTVCIIFTLGAVGVAEAGGGKRVKTGKTSFGTILQDKRGHSLYLFTRDRGRWSNCYGDCADVWPPLLTAGKPVAVGGAKQAELGTTRRRSGKLQVTYNGHPLYYFVSEDEPNEVLCQAAPEFGGIWYVVNRNGAAIK